MSAYYNEFDPKAAAWLRELIKAGHIAPGDVDERSIVDIRPSDLIGYTQCHFFAGIGVWSYALRRAGWPDDRPVWTGSCPCQPFSAAGKGAGFTDERHLWPHFHWLIENCRPPVVFGEQVASKDGLGWLDLVQADLEGSGYASGAVDTCAAGFGAPHIRQRLYWVAHADDAGSQGWRGMPERAAERAVGSGGMADGVADADQQQWHWSGGAGSTRWREPANVRTTRRLAHNNDYRCFAPSVTGFHNSEHHFEPCGDQSGLGNFCGPDCYCELTSDRPSRECLERLADTNKQHGHCGGYGSSNDCWQRIGSTELRGSEQTVLRPSPTNGQWRDADWLFCRDGKWRPVEPGTFPLAHGTSARVGQLRGYGNAIVAPAAQAFIEAYLETEIVAANDNYANGSCVA
ncbi:DNA cytosine methyltransferase [Brucella intermedia]|uniref:DNA cytosine methyltransferase n=1 Tax=Brucella intermedia TaxID=94625 RepID=UPI00224B8475|nr:DNA cytosine methyltransferase [Brucella intermedia]